MPELHRLAHSKAVIRMYADDHVPPHFHISGPGWAAQINIDTLEVTRGSVPPDVLSDTRKWAIANIEMLKRKWRELNERDR